MRCPALEIAGTLTFVTIAAFFAWTIAQSRRTQLTVPGLAMLGAMTNLVIGAVLGILLGLQLAGRTDSLPGRDDCRVSALMGGRQIDPGWAAIAIVHQLIARLWQESATPAGRLPPSNSWD